MVVFTHPLIRLVLHQLDTLGQLAKWAIELGKFNIKCLPRLSIKAQVVVDFILECTILEESEFNPKPGLEFGIEEIIEYWFSTLMDLLKPWDAKLD